MAAPALAIVLTSQGQGQWWRRQPRARTERRQMGTQARQTACVQQTACGLPGPLQVSTWPAWYMCARCSK